MKYSCVILFVFISLFLPLNFALASVPGEEPDVLQIRAGKHSGFMRIVLEGEESVITEGRVSQQGKDITVRFADKKFEIKNEGLPVTCRAESDAVTFALDEAAKIKSFSLKDPSRFVIDVYPAEEKTNEEARPEPEPENKKTQNNKTEKRKAENKKAENKKVENKKVENKKAENKKAENITAAATGSSISGRTEDVVSGSTSEPAKTYDDKRLIPEQYKSMWSLLESGNFYAVLKEIPAHKPDNAESRAALNYIYARAHIMSGQQMDAVKYLRLAYIYAPDRALKERALLERAGVYMQLQLYYEARADYIVFIRDFPSSSYIDKANAGLAGCLYRIGLFLEAIEHYKKAGRSPDVMYGMANAMQKLEMVKEAKKVYDEAMLMDSSILKDSPETYFLMGENMRMSGDMEGAKKHFSRIETGPYRDHAIISTGLIAMDESNLREAVRQFKIAAESRDHKIKVRALFSLSLAYLKEGKFKEATSSLEEIRNNHINSSMYKDTLLLLSKIYKKEGRVKESVSLLKELVYGKQPPAEAFSELEEMVLGTAASGSKDGLTFVTLWNDVGQWLVDGSREEFLLKVAGRLRHEGKPFIDLCTWLVENASDRVRGRAAVDLADYYIGIGNSALSWNYINSAKHAGASGDGVLRVEAKMLYAEGERTEALRQIMKVTETEKGDLALLGKIISGSGGPDMKEKEKAIAFYEHALHESEWDADTYINFADILYARDERSKSLTYYRFALEKDPDNEWAIYRLARETERQEAEGMYDSLQKGDDIIARLARSKLKEIDLMKKIREVY